MASSWCRLGGRVKGARIVLTRRDLMKLGLMSFPVLDWGPSVALARTNAGKGSDAVTSPPTRPFVVELPIPPVAQAVQTLEPAPDPAAHQRYSEFPPRVFYEIHQKEAKHSFHPDLPENLIWGFDGIFPGPTFHARYGEPIIVRFYNDLPANHVGFGFPKPRPTCTMLTRRQRATAFRPTSSFRDNARTTTIRTSMPVETPERPWGHCGTTTTAWTSPRKTFTRALLVSTSFSMS